MSDPLGFLDDLDAFLKAERRSVASQIMTEERFNGAVFALRDSGCSVRRIAALTSRSVFRVLLAMVRDQYPRTGQSDPREYDLAQNNAWSHIPALMVQTDQTNDESEDH